ncbi:unnamed protein product [Prorocentrum cordatum]|uniref:Uncharacterized protein n=1 Tax=Prorocentrum cordatum TaxID=2364126 RepID=A0ABN9UHG4_9DINO|nr:unnamed protein product [Polarella glacialis]
MTTSGDPGSPVKRLHAIRLNEEASEQTPPPSPQPPPLTGGASWHQAFNVRKTDPVNLNFRRTPVGQSGTAARPSEIVLNPCRFKRRGEGGEEQRKGREEEEKEEEEEEECSNECGQAAAVHVMPTRTRVQLPTASYASRRNKKNVQCEGGGVKQHIQEKSRETNAHTR